eukprot:Rhum_TRINITY_DN15883_c0_g1::Rhum_TRINITY_DN15883_c0_g1_i1::g.162336::m.162336
MQRVAEGDADGRRRCEHQAQHPAHGPVAVHRSSRVDRPQRQRQNRQLEHRRRPHGGRDAEEALERKAAHARGVPDAQRGPALLTRLVHAARREDAGKVFRRKDASVVLRPQLDVRVAGGNLCRHALRERDGCGRGPPEESGEGRQLRQQDDLHLRRAHGPVVPTHLLVEAAGLLVVAVHRQVHQVGATLPCCLLDGLRKRTADTGPLHPVVDAQVEEERNLLGLTPQANLLQSEADAANDCTCFVLFAHQQRLLREGRRLGFEGLVVLELHLEQGTLDAGRRHVGACLQGFAGIAIAGEVGAHGVESGVHGGVWISLSLSLSLNEVQIL